MKDSERRSEILRFKDGDYGPMTELLTDFIRGNFWKQLLPGWVLCATTASTREKHATRYTRLIEEVSEATGRIPARRRRRISCGTWSSTGRESGENGSFYLMTSQPEVLPSSNVPRSCMPMGRSMSADSSWGRLWTSSKFYHFSKVISKINLNFVQIIMWWVLSAT